MSMSESGSPANFAGRVEELRRRAAENAKPKKTDDKYEKFCPFSLSHPNGPVACSEKCKLYRNTKTLYSCPFQELSAISFSLRPLH